MENLTKSKVEELIKEIKLPNKAFIAGKKLDSVSGKTFNVISPIDGKVIAKVSDCGKDDIENAVSAARIAYEKGLWSRLDMSKRKERFYKLADLMNDNLIELALMETLDMGKPISISIGEIKRCVECVKWYAECIDKIYDEIAPTKENLLALIRRVPFGVVGAIIPWNYPLFMAVWKFAPALITGNSVVLKPAEQSPHSLLRLAELVIDAGIPEGVLNIVPGLGSSAGKELALNMDVDRIAFTGSTEVGKLIMKYSGMSNMKRVSLECGGKSPFIVFADAYDMKNAAKQLVDEMFYNSGQVCDAPTRLLVEKKIKTEFIELVKEYSNKYIPGNPLDPETNMGPVVDKRQLEKILGYVESARNGGGEVLVGGNRVLTESNGYYIEPTIISNVNNDMSIVKDEIFGPVLVIQEFEDDDEAVMLANDTVYGLAATVWTRDINRAMSLSDRIVSGKVMINTTSAGDMTIPHGGMKMSGFGRDKAIESIHEFTQTKVTIIEM